MTTWVGVIVVVGDVVRTVPAVTGCGGLGMAEGGGGGGGREGSLVTVVALATCVPMVNGGGCWPGGGDRGDVSFAGLLA